MTHDVELATAYDEARDRLVRVAYAFLGAAAGGDLAGLVRLLGPDDVARFMAGIARKHDDVELVEVNGRTGLAVRVAGRLHSVVSFTVDGGQITRIDIVLAPDKLSAVPSATP